MCSVLRIGRDYLRGNFKIIRKIRLVHFIRKLITEGIVVRGVREIYEEGVTILSEMERREVEEEEEEGYMSELYLLKIRGIWKKMKEDEVGVLRKEVLEEKRQREETERRLEEATKAVEEEKRKKEEVEKRRGREKKRKKHMRREYLRCRRRWKRSTQRRGRRKWNKRRE